MDTRAEEDDVFALGVGDIVFNGIAENHERQIAFVAQDGCVERRLCDGELERLFIPRKGFEFYGKEFRFVERLGRCYLYGNIFVEVEVCKEVFATLELRRLRPVNVHIFAVCGDCVRTVRLFGCGGGVGYDTSAGEKSACCEHCGENRGFYEDSRFIHILFPPD